MLILGYFVYGKIIDRLFGADNSRPTPAVTKEDGVDYIKLPPWKIFLTDPEESSPQKNFPAHPDLILHLSSNFHWQSSNGLGVAPGSNKESSSSSGGGSGGVILKKKLSCTSRPHTAPFLKFSLT
jgi:hypothetical protein